MVGLDAAGKTTILYKLKLGEIVTTIPTIGKDFFTGGVNTILLSLCIGVPAVVALPFPRQVGAATLLNLASLFLF